MRGAESGFTLIEMVITLILVGIIAAITGIMMQQGIMAYLAQTNEANIADQGRLGIERMAREIRTIRSRTAADIPTMTAATLSFVDIGGNAIAYTSGGGNITRNGTLLATGNAAALGFSYFQQNGAPAVAAAQVWVIQVDLSLTTGGQTQAFRIRVHPRSFT
jgi:prepilin-type N-terminal cleavage/methylation domain-containing protein